MDYLLAVLIGVVAVEHLYFMYLEMFLWTKPKGLKVFGLTQEKARITRSLAANQGLYNGFLAAGLIWSLLQAQSHFTMQLQVFFLLCVIVAAVYGGLTVKRSILFIQGLPAMLALLVLAALEYGFAG